MDAPTVAALLSVSGLAVITTIVTEIIVRAWKPAPDLLDRVGPLLAVVVACVFAIPAAISQQADIFQALLTGVVVGGMSMGIHDGTHAATGG